MQPLFCILLMLRRMNAALALLKTKSFLLPGMHWQDSTRTRFNFWAWQWAYKANGWSSKKNTTKKPLNFIQMALVHQYYLIILQNSQCTRNKMWENVEALFSFTVCHLHLYLTHMSLVYVWRCFMTHQLKMKLNLFCLYVRKKSQNCFTE